MAPYSLGLAPYFAFIHLSLMRQISSFITFFYQLFQLHDVLNEQVPSSDDDEKADHDFDVVSHAGCDYEDNGKGLNIDVDRIIGNTERKVMFTCFYKAFVHAFST